MQSVLPSSLTAVTPKAKKARLGFGNLSWRPRQSTVTGDVQNEKRFEEMLLTVLHVVLAVGISVWQESKSCHV